MKHLFHRASLNIVWLSACLFSTSAVWAAETMPLAELGKHTHIHGIAVDAHEGSRIYLATHHGVFSVDTQGVAVRVSEDTNDYMGFTPHPSNPDILFASGHPVGGGNLGFITSTDGGRTWRQLSPGAGGPVDFHQMDVSKADPNVFYGTFRGLQVSRDGGNTWALTAPLPERVIDLAASAMDADRLYAATEGGLLYSTDAGVSWQPAHASRSPASMVQTGHAGEVYAFVLGLGLVKTMESDLRWETVSNTFGQRYVLHLAADPRNPNRLYCVTNDKLVLASNDGGASWVSMGGAK